MSFALKFRISPFVVGKRFEETDRLLATSFFNIISFVPENSRSVIIGIHYRWAIV